LAGTSTKILSLVDYEDTKEKNAIPDEKNDSNNVSSEKTEGISTNIFCKQCGKETPPDTILGLPRCPSCGILRSLVK